MLPPCCISDSLADALPYPSPPRAGRPHPVPVPAILRHRRGGLRIVTLDAGEDRAIPKGLRAVGAVPASVNASGCEIA